MTLLIRETRFRFITGERRGNVSDFLVHHGVKGMHWGVWNDQTRIRYAGGKRHVNSSMMENLKNAKTSNIDKWGTNRDQNVLYITGLSGSGKSTVTEGLRDNNTNVIHLDFYTNVGAKSIAAKAYRDKEFNEHLRKIVLSFLINTMTKCQQSVKCQNRKEKIFGE